MLDLNFAFSRKLMQLLVTLHVAALLSAISVEAPLYFKITCFSLLALSCITHCANFGARQFPWSIVSAKIESAGDIALQLRNGKLVEGAILEGSFVAPWLTILRYRRQDSWLPRSLIILPDMLPPDTFRQLRVWLKWRRPVAQTGF